MISYEMLAKLPGATDASRSATGEFNPPSATYPNGTHVCKLELDPDTGTIEVSAT